MGRNKAAVNAVKLARGNLAIPIFVQVTVETTGTLLVGADIAAAATVIHSLDVPLMGLNCATGPQETAGARARSPLPPAGIGLFERPSMKLPLAFGYREPFSPVREKVMPFWSAAIPLPLFNARGLDSSEPGTSVTGPKGNRLPWNVRPLWAGH